MLAMLDTLRLFSISKPALGVPNKHTVIRVRWLVVIVACYLLIFSREISVSAAFVHAFALSYILSNALLYFIDPKRFSACYFIPTLVILDTLALSFALILAGQLGSELYLTYFLIIIIAGFWCDFRWSLAFGILISLLYSYLLLIGENLDTYIFLRVPFLFIVSLFYGYFTQMAAQERLLREKLEIEARKDFLTGLLNRKAFEERLREEVERARRYDRPFSLLMVDIDNFKVVNDSLGHHWGDTVLQTVAKRLKGSVRKIDFVARVGGEEFVVILPETDTKGAVQLANRIRLEIKNSPIETPKGLLAATVSIGVSCTLVQQDVDQVRMTCDADQALYLAKQKGKDRVETLSNQNLDYTDLA